MIVQLNEAKQYLRVDGDYDDGLITILIHAAEEYLKNATGKEFESSNNLAKLFCLAFVAEWYENRIQVGNASGEMSLTIYSLLEQLRQDQTVKAQMMGETGVSSC